MLDAIDSLYSAANDLARERPSDPVVPQLGSLAKQAEQVFEVIKKRTKG